MIKYLLLSEIALAAAVAIGTHPAIAAGVEPNVTQELVNLARSCANAENPPNTIIESCTHVLDMGLFKDPKMMAITYNNRGSGYARRGDLENALADFNNAVRLDPTYAMAYFNVGKSYVASGFFDRAVEHLDQAVELAPGYVDAYIERGVARAKLRQFDLAIRDFDEALRLQPGNALAEANRALAQKESKTIIAH